MCQGGRLLADFVAGTRDQPNVPELAGNLTHTVEGEWLVWAYKLARPQHDGFVPLTGRGGSYPADAQAECSVGPERRSVRIPAAPFTPQRGALLESRHSAPDPACSCGFHALSNLSALNFMGGPSPRRNRGEPSLACLAVVLSGRVLAFEWPGGPGTVLFRAARQTVVSVAPFPSVSRTGEELWTVEQVLAASTPSQGWWPTDPGDPDGRLACLPLVQPFGSGPVQLQLPSEPARAAVDDHVGWCGPATWPARQLAELVAT
jgi:hypothetical protein